MRNLITLIAVAAISISTAIAEPFPVKEITIINSGTASAATGLMARALAKGLGKRKIESIVVDKPGGDRLIGAMYVAKSPADGYTILLGSASDVVMLPLVKPEGSTITESTFIPVASLSTLSPALVVRSDFPANNLPEFLELVRKDPGKYPIGVNSNLAKLFAAQVYNLAGVNPTFVPYKGVNLGTVDVAAGVLPVMVSSLGSDSDALVDAGKIKILFSLSKTRSKNYPNVSVVSETYPGPGSDFWFGLFVPAGTPKDRVDMLSAEFKRVLQDPEVIATAESLSQHIYYLDSEQTKKYYSTLINMYRPLVEKYLK